MKPEIKRTMTETPEWTPQPPEWASADYNGVESRIVAAHGEPAGLGVRGFYRLQRKVGKHPLLAAPYTRGHSHNATPPFWRRMWLRLRGKWPLKIAVNGSINAHRDIYKEAASHWDNDVVIVGPDGKLQVGSIKTSGDMLFLYDTTPQPPRDFSQTKRTPPEDL